MALDLRFRVCTPTPQTVTLKVTPDNTVGDVVARATGQAGHFGPCSLLWYGRAVGNSQLMGSLQPAPSSTTIIPIVPRKGPAPGASGPQMAPQQVSEMERILAQALGIPLQAVQGNADGAFAQHARVQELQNLQFQGAGGGNNQQEMLQQLQNLLQGGGQAGGGQAQGQAAAAAPAAAAAAAVVPAVDEEALQRLMEMGIGDEDMCRRALQAAGNNIDTAAMLLFEEMQMQE